MDKMVHSHTSPLLRVRMDVEPNNVLHTSPERFEDFANKFINKYPKAKAPTEIIAMAASPLIFVFCPVRSSNIAQIMVMGNTNTILSVRFKIEAIAKAPKETWDKPSPIKENRFNTKVTPNKEEQSAIKTPTIKAYCTNG